MSTALAVAGVGKSYGAFDALHSTIAMYSSADGLVTSQQTNLASEVSNIGKQIQDMETRLTIQQQAMQQEFSAADQAISQMNNQQSALSSLGGQYRLF